MTEFIKNVNTYLQEMKIKQTYVSMKTGIDTRKLSRILTGTQDIGSADMEKIAAALGRNVGFFLSESFELPRIGEWMPERIAFYAGEPTKKQEKMAEKLILLIENADQVLSAKNRFMGLSEE